MAVRAFTHRAVGTVFASSPAIWRALLLTDRIPLIVGFVVDEVLAEAGTVVMGVPGEQLEPLRAAIRRRLRSLGVPFRTYPLGGDLHVVSEELWDDIPEGRKAEIGARTAAVIADVIQGRPVPRRGIDWGTWGIL